MHFHELNVKEILRYGATLKKEYVVVRGGGIERDCKVCHLKPTVF